jgi:uncharacterized membrane protein YdjX (TVP38/TMEM64 family)
MRWALLCLVILAIILVPFALFGEYLEMWTNDFLRSASNQPVWVAIFLCLILATDILLPIPSSLVSTTAGFLLGFVAGVATSLIGMMVGCLVGYWLAVKWGRTMASRLVGHELEQLENISLRFGDWVIVVSRPVPVLAEASVFFAGLSRMPFHRFLLLTTLSNFGISIVYASVGAFSATLNSFLLALMGSIMIPLIAMFAMKKMTQKNAEVKSL